MRSITREDWGQSRAGELHDLAPPRPAGYFSATSRPGPPQSCQATGGCSRQSSTCAWCRASRSPRAPRRRCPHRAPHPLWSRVAKAPWKLIGIAPACIARPQGLWSGCHSHLSYNLTDKGYMPARPVGNDARAGPSGRHKRLAAQVPLDQASGREGGNVSGRFSSVPRTEESHKMCLVKQVSAAPRPTEPVERSTSGRSLVREGYGCTPPSARKRCRLSRD